MVQKCAATLHRARFPRRCERVSHWRLVFIGSLHATLPSLPPVATPFIGHSTIGLVSLQLARDGRALCRRFIAVNQIVSIRLPPHEAVLVDAHLPTAKGVLSSDVLLTSRVPADERYQLPNRAGSSEVPMEAR